MMTDPTLDARIGDLLESATSAAQRDIDPGVGEPVEASPAAQALIAHRGQVVAQAQAGAALLFAPSGALLPPGTRTALPADPVFDVASLTKVLVAATALIQMRRGTLTLEEPVHRYLPAFASSPEKEEVTIAHLLTHTSGLPAVWKAWAVDGGRAERCSELLRVDLQNRPGVEHTYSCVGYQVLGMVLEHLSELPLPALLARDLTGPLQMSQTSYTPPDPGRVVPTEYQSVPDRGLVHAQVHDEAAWSLGGAGNAGVFSTAGDILAFGEAVRTASAPLDQQIRELLSSDTLTGAQRTRSGYGQAIGFRLAQSGFMGSDPSRSIGHTGFTGTSLVIDPDRELTIVLFTNRVHPYRSAFEITGLRRQVADTARQWVQQT